MLYIFFYFKEHNKIQVFLFEDRMTKFYFENLIKAFGLYVDWKTKRLNLQNLPHNKFLFRAFELSMQLMLSFFFILQINPTNE